jgi:hypothetical protein
MQPIPIVLIVVAVLVVLAVFNERRHARLGHDSYWPRRWR